MDRRRPGNICRRLRNAPCWRLPFVRGLLLGVILMGLLFVSWRLVLAAAGILALFFLLRNWE